jgi:hypothetical protein
VAIYTIFATAALCLTFFLPSFPCLPVYHLSGPNNSRDLMLPQQKKKSKDTPTYILAGLKHKKSVFLGILEGPVFHLYMFILRVCDWLTVLRMTFHNRTKERWKRNISTTRDETAHMLLITGRSTICSYVACKRLFLFCFSPSLFWTGADAISILTMSLTKIGHYSCLHHRVNTVSCLFNHITAERTSWFLSYYTCDIRYVSAQDADI